MIEPRAPLDLLNQEVLDRVVCAHPPPERALLSAPLEALRMIWRARALYAGTVYDVEITHTWKGKRTIRRELRNLDAWRRDGWRLRDCSYVCRGPLRVRRSTLLKFGAEVARDARWK